MSERSDRNQKQNQESATVLPKLKPLLGAHVTVKGHPRLKPCTGVIDQIDEIHVHVTPDDGVFTINRGGWYHPSVLKIERP